jgi:ABC-type uncharacterized transport system substrate-binding protein
MEKLSFSRMKRILASALVATLVLVAMLPRGEAFHEPGHGSKPKWRVLHIMSYHLPWEWTETQFQGFKAALHDLDIGYKVFQMDTKRRSTEEWKQAVGKQARQFIETWKPDLVYTNDDDAQEYVARHYVNTSIPFVFSGVNADPRKYGFVGSANVTGVVEHEHFVESVALLKGIVPHVRKIAVILDESPMWDPVVQRMRMRLPELPGISVISWDVIKTFGQYKQRMKELQSQADTVALIGIFTFKGENGNNVPYQEVLRWTAENSRLPDFSFWKDRISHGTLCAVSVSGYEQGLAAGKIARGILAEGRSPESYPMKPSVRGEPLVSLARANALGIKIKTNVLLTANVMTKFIWEK